ncbi:hypothetical protein [Caproiciproducens galactitolivorans]|uniref:Uncharacterized protein n=1 Tax=Caproiciproducens galactitolivorans TaxID=642589 RepID=A0ABT4BUV8_9FIRM|nr:hypothetical protein [Caproiciproducens galactitolivorans]MCY1713698.1 hypothetical protein [Caproiciproducens galactitolivorans]
MNFYSTQLKGESTMSLRLKKALFDIVGFLLILFLFLEWKEKAYQNYIRLTGNPYSLIEAMALSFVLGILLNMVGKFRFRRIWKPFFLVIAAFCLLVALLPFPLIAPLFPPLIARNFLTVQFLIAAYAGANFISAFLEPNGINNG